MKGIKSEAKTHKYTVLVQESSNQTENHPAKKEKKGIMLKPIYIYIFIYFLVRHDVSALDLI